MTREHAEAPVQTVPELLRARVATYPDTELLVTPTERLTYRQAEQQSREVARRMLTGGIGKNTRVGVLFPNTPEWIVSWLAATRIGALAIPISTYHQAPELARTLRHADVNLLLMTPRHLNHDYLDRLERVAPALTRSGAGRLFLHALPHLRDVWTYAPNDRPWTRGADQVPVDDRVDDELLRHVEAEVSAVGAGDGDLHLGVDRGDLRASSTRTAHWSATPPGSAGWRTAFALAIGSIRPTRFSGSAACPACCSRRYTPGRPFCASQGWTRRPPCASWNVSGPPSSSGSDTLAPHSSRIRASSSGICEAW